MNTKTLARTLALSAALLAPALASAQQYNSDGSPRYSSSHGHRHYYRQSHYRTCGADQRMRANNGTAIGAVSGGVLGATLGGGVGNTLLGAGAGAIAGHEIGKHTAHC